MVKRLYKFPEVLFFQEGPGVRNHQYTTSGVKLLNVSNLRNGKIDLTTSDRYISENEAFNKYSHFLCDTNDFIIASSGIKIDSFDSKMGFIHQSDLPVCMNTSTIRFKVLNKEVLEIRYFMYYLKSIAFKKVLTKVVTGSAQLNFGPSHLKNMSISLPNLDIQKNIVQRLDRVNKLIEIKRKLLFQLDELVKSRFVEMFGDPNASRTKYKLVPIHMVTDCMVPGRDKPKSFTGEIPWITINDLNINGYTNKSKLGLGLTIDEVKEVNRKCIPQGSVLMSCVGNLGLCSIASVDVVINQQLHSYQCNKLINNLYLMYYLSFKNIYMNKIASSTTVLYMNKNACNNIPVLLPPIELQISFAKYLNQINKLKSDVQKSIDETQLLMDSLMQEYFG